MMMSRHPRTRHRFRGALAAAVTGIVTVSLAACAGGGSSGGAAAGSGGSATSGTVNWWGWSPSAEAAKADIAEFNKVYPNIGVNYKLLPVTGVAAAMRPALASGALGPDVFNVTPGPELTSWGGFALDLSSAATKALGTDWKSKLAAGGIGTLTTSSGKFAAISLGSIFAGTLWINQDLFGKYHVTPPTTLAEWVSDCKVFKAHGVGCFVQGVASLGFSQDTLQEIADSVSPGTWTEATEGKTKWTSPAFVQMLTIWKSLFSNGIMEPGALAVQQYPDASNDFLSGKYAMIEMGTWYTPNATKAGMTDALSAAGVSSPTPFTAIPIPFPNVAGAGHKGGYYFGESDFGLAVNSKSKVRNAATTFVTWMTTSKEGQQLVANELNDFPSLKGINPDWKSIALVDQSAQLPVISKLIAQTSAVTEPREAPLNAQMQQAIQVAATTVAAGQATPAQAAATLQSSAEQAGVKFG
jgi:ABC-type glycerol-3-phosphate transport system substrate-binding protein